MNTEHLQQMIDQAFVEERQAELDEYRALSRRDHAGAADAHKARWRALDRAGVLIGKLPHMRGTT